VSAAGPERSVPRERLARNGDVRLHYLDGPGGGARGAPVVFVPGLSDVASDYTDVLASFGRRAVVMDLRGRGASDSPPRGYALDDHVGDIEAVLAEAGIDRFHLATFSRGTSYGLGFALRHPEQVLTIAIGDYDAREVGLTVDFVPSFHDGRWRGTPVSSRLTRIALEGIARESVERPLWDDLARLGTPVLVVRGGRPDRPGFLRDEGVARYRAAVPDVEIVTFDDSSHDIFRPDPTRFATLVARFIERHERT